MKWKICFGTITLLLCCVSDGKAQGTPTFFEHVYVSRNSARVVFEHSPFEETNALIEIYDTKSHQKIGQISRARRLILPSEDDTKPSFEFEELSAEALAPDGRHLLVRRLPLAKTPSTESSDGYDDEAFLESWDIAKTPRLEWRKRGVLFSHVKWIKGQIVVLLSKEVQRWNERGEIMSRLSLAGFAIGGPSGSYSNNTLSSDGKCAVISTDPPLVIETQKGHVLQKLDMRWPEQPVEFMFGPKNRYIWGSGLVVIEGSVASKPCYIWSAINGKVQKASPQNPIFSPDGSAFWNDWKFRFDSIATGKAASLRAPAPFTNGTAFLQAVSADSCVWAGLTGQGKPFWVTIR